jgi:hypothetical protein
MNAAPIRPSNKRQRQGGPQRKTGQGIEPDIVSRAHLARGHDIVSRAHDLEY